MKKIFFSGSASIKTLPSEITDMIRNTKDIEILVGDCMGVDTLVQAEAKNANVPVTVYCSGNKCRNKLDPSWSVKHIAANGLYGRDFYTAKDIAMVNDCDEAVAVWDGKSKGTLRNIEQCKALGKTITVVKNSI